MPPQAFAGEAKSRTCSGQSRAGKRAVGRRRAAAIDLAAGAVASSVNSQVDAKVARAEAAKSKGQADAANNRAENAENEKPSCALSFTTAKSNSSNAGYLSRTYRQYVDSLFKTGSSELLPPVREKLAKIAGIVSSHPGLKLSVEGHTDNVGSEQYNQRLSEKRAQAALDYLVSQGVPADSIVSQGFWKRQPNRIK